jgi:energy-coupling factor transporter transmembrane protein EcfT
MNNHFLPAAEKIVADYLEKMKTHLKGMNENDQKEILAEIAASRMGESVSRLGQQKKSLLYIISGFLIIFFAAPLGMGGLAVIAGLLFALLGLLIAYFATAVSFVVSGFICALVGLIAIISPDIFLEINHWAGEAVFQFGPFQNHPQIAGVITLIIALLLAALGLLMLWSGKHIWRGLRFVLNLMLEKIRKIFSHGHKKT